MRVHTTAVLPKDRLRHERSSKPEAPGDILHHESERRDVVGSLEGLGVPEIDLMLAVRDFVVRRRNREAQPLEHSSHRAPRTLADTRSRTGAIVLDTALDM